MSQRAWPETVDRQPREDIEPMRKNLKILGLSLLTFTAVMAVGASAVQAKWLLLKNGASANLLNLNVSVNAGEFLVEDLGMKIYCSAGGTGSADLSLNSPSNTVLSTSASVTFHGCLDLEFESVCDVHSLGQPNGLITATGSGVASMSGSNMYINISSAELATIVYLGNECPLHEVSLAGDIVSGSVKFEVLEHTTSAKLHQIDLVGQALLYGGQPAELHEPLSGSVTEATGAFFAVHLLNL